VGNSGKELLMSAANTTKWIGIGLLGLPLYGVLTFWSALNPQSDPNIHYEAWSRYVTTDFYLLKHLFGSILGLILSIFGVVALGAYLARSRAGRMGLVAMVITVFGSALFLTVGGVSAFSAPEQGQMHLQGIEGYREIPPVLAQTAMIATFGVSSLLLFVGNLLLSVAVWRSGTLPRWAGALLAAAAVFMYPLGLLITALVTSSTTPTVLVGAVLIVISGGWIAWSVMRRSTAGTVGIKAQPRVQ
jgi:hypothetical protein